MLARIDSLNTLVVSSPLGLSDNSGEIALAQSRSHFGFGLVDHALCAAIRDVLKVIFPRPPGDPTAVKCCDGSTLSLKRQRTGTPPQRAAGDRLPGGACKPPLLEGWEHKFLLAGKYLNLIPRLRSLENYFFLASLSVAHLLDLSYTELKKPAKGVSIVKLLSLLDLALLGMPRSAQIGVIGGEEGDDLPDKAKKDCDWEKDGKKPVLAIDTLTLDYNVKFPLSLVISRKTILRYQLLFRFLLHLRHVEQSLASVWIEQKKIPWQRLFQTNPSSSGGDYELYP
ncbi:Spc98 family-domain-containing protein [Suillus cothurnatus]|nr:Spc98 family-domain-containing protein [Suillus cothurnatus]